MMPEETKRQEMFVQEVNALALQKVLAYPVSTAEDWVKPHYERPHSELPRQLSVLAFSSTRQFHSFQVN